MWILVGCVESEPPELPTVATTTELPSGTGSTEVPSSPTTGEPPPTPVPGSLLQFTGKAPTNLIIVSLDTTRRDFVGRYGALGRTPNLDALMEEGVALDDHRSCSSWTAPSMTCVTTGSTPFDLDWFPSTADPDVADTHAELPTLAGQLQFQKGFRTSLLTANAIMGPLIGLDRGFQSVDNLDATTATVIADAAIDEARTLAQVDDSPFYLHVHFVDPHSPYCPPDEFIDAKAYEPFPDDLCDFDVFWSMAAEYPTQSGQWRDQFMGDALEVYAAEIEYWDAEFGRMWDGFEAAGALDDTLVLFVTDHGEQFYERGGWLHGTTLTAEENRAVAMFWADGIVPVSWTEPTVHEDLGATVMDFFGVAPPEPATGIVVGTAPADRPVRGMLYWDGGGAAQLSIVQGELQLTYGFWGEKHLWDYALDPLGLVDYYDPNDPDVQALWVPMEAYVTDVLKQWPSAGPVTDPGP